MKDRHGSPVDGLDDGALLSAVGLGDGRAAAAFVGRFARPVHGVAVAVCGDNRLAEDIAQTTFERAWRHAGSYDPRLGSVRTWILTICRRLAIDAVRMRRSTPVDPEGMAALLAPSADTAPADAAASHEMVRVRAALARLPEPQRRALLLATLGGHTAVEIAAIEDIPVGTAKTRLRTGLHRLRDLLGAAVPVDPPDPVVTDGSRRG